MKFGNIYWDERMMDEDHRRASILAIGDSWFWYPFPGGSLLNALSPIVGAGQHTVYTIGRNGAEAFDYVHGVYSPQVDWALKQHGDGLSAVFISGGGNDFAGLNDLRPLLGEDCSACTKESECFIDSQGNDLLDAFMVQTLDSLGALVWRVFSRLDENVKVLLHNYDYPIPTGKGVFGTDWLRSSLVVAGVRPELHAKCMKMLIDRFTVALKKLAASSPRIVVVDSREALRPADWANELHPTPAGFAKVAERWKPGLKAAGLIA
jgi:hypothetical protein